MPSRGQPAHRPSEKSRNQVALLVGLGWLQAKISSALNLDEKTLRKYYSHELKREGASDRLDFMMAKRLWDLFICDGSVAACREFRILRERNDRIAGMAAPQSVKLGLKAQALVDAQRPNEDTELGRLMAQREARIEAEGEPH